MEEEREPIEASANVPAVLHEPSGYSVVASAEPTVETKVTVDFSGDVELTSRQDVIATLFQRVYENPDGRRFGLLTAPAVRVVEQPEVVRDPVTALEDARVAELATDRSVTDVGEFEADGSATMLGTEAARTKATATIDGGDHGLARVRVRAGDDSVTAMATDPEEATPPFGDVTRDA
jgi:hypothetical protein